VYFRSKAWANDLLKLGIRECQNLDRVELARFSEVLYFIKLLKEEGFPWQARILKSWLYRYWAVLRPVKVDSQTEFEGGL
jgi:hypothetical protein